MALSFDAVTGGQSTTDTSLTYSHTVGSGDKRILIVGITTLGSNTDKVSGVTYAGTAMTRITTQAGPSSGDEFVYLYYLLNPATGANNVVISLTDSRTVASAAASYFGAKQSGQPDNSVANQGESTSTLAATLTPVADSCWLIGFARNQSGGNVGVGASTTLRGAATTFNIVDSNAAISPPASTSLNVTSSSGDMYIVAASIAPFIGGGNFHTLII